MNTRPEENPQSFPGILVHQFRSKGYNCREVKQADAILLIITHEKRPSSTSASTQNIKPDKPFN